MAHRLIANGYDLTVWNRTISKTDKLKSEDAKVAAQPSVAIKSCETIITMLTDYNAVSEVLFADKNDFKGKTIIQMSTISPDENILLKDRVEQFGGEFLEAPVLGSIPQIENGKLITMVGGSKEQFKKWKKFFESFGESVIHIGDVGKASSAKLALNQLISSTTAAFSMSLGYVREKGIDVEKFMQILRQSSVYAPNFDRKLNGMLNRDYTNTHFPLKHMLKDVNLILNEFSNHGIETSVLEGVRKILLEGVRNNLSELDYSSFYEIIHQKK